jgi:hypothetical protein
LHKDWVYFLSFEVDNDPIDPRNSLWSENLGKMTYRNETLFAPTHHAIVLPMYKYEHGNVAFNTTGFNCCWDSGQVGTIHADYADIYKEFGCKRITKKIRAKVEALLRGEVETFSHWANGDVHGYIVGKVHVSEIAADCQNWETLTEKEQHKLLLENHVWDFQDDEIIDVCWGYYGGLLALYNILPVTNEKIEVLYN